MNAWGQTTEDDASYLLAETFHRRCTIAHTREERAEVLQSSPSSEGGKSFALLGLADTFAQKFKKSNIQASLVLNYISAG